MYFKNLAITGIGAAVPKEVMTNEVLENLCPTSADWIHKHLGIKERRIAADTQLVSDLGVEAAKEALKNAGVDKEDIDLIIVATSSPEKIAPATACTIHNKLGIKKDTPAFDINAVCSGFIFGLGIAAPLISSGMYKNILLIASETYSKITDYSSRDCVFFGDGAGAVVISAGDGWIFTELKSNGGDTGGTGFMCPLNSSYKTIPSQVWEQGHKVLPDSIRSVLQKTNTSADDISLLIPHQASKNMLTNIANEIGLDPKKIKTVMHKYGNIAGASIPIALHDAFIKNEIKKGDKILLTAIGSGWSWGSILLNYK